MAKKTTDKPDATTPDIHPERGGSWIRNKDGSLSPNPDDEATVAREEALKNPPPPAIEPAPAGGQEA